MFSLKFKNSKEDILVKLKKKLKNMMTPALKITIKKLTEKLTQIIKLMNSKR